MATEVGSAGAGAAYEEERRKRILENQKHLEDLGISKMAKGFVQAIKQQAKVLTPRIACSGRTLAISVCGGIAYHLPSNKCEMVLEDEEGGKFDAIYIGNRTGLSGGWSSFSVHHNLEGGDSLVFELAEPDRFKIYICKAIEDANEAKPDDTVDRHSTEEEPASVPPSSPEPLKRAKRRKLGGRR